MNGNIRRLTAVCTALLLSLTLMAGCSNKKETQTSSIEASLENRAETVSNEEEQPNVSVADKVAVRVGTLKGPTGMGMAGLMENNALQETDNIYTFTLSGSPEDMTAKILNGEVDIAAVPTNMAAVLYNKTQGDVHILAVNTLGVLYILDNGQNITSMADLKGKTLAATGQASAPEYVLNHLLTKNGLDPKTDVTMEYKSEHSELATLMASGDVNLGMLPQPFVTSVTTQNQDVKIALDLTAEWSKITPDTPLAMGCLVVRADFLDSNKEAVDRFLVEYEESVNFVNRDIGDAAELMEKYDIIPKAVAEKAIPYCNILFLGGSDMQSAVQGFLQVLFDANPQSVGGQMPDEAFYYKR